VSRWGWGGDQHLDDNGKPLSRGKLYFYETGTSTAKATYSDAYQTVPNTWPIVLSASGRQGDVFFSGTARLVVLSADNVQLDESDPVSNPGSDPQSPVNALSISSGVVTIDCSLGNYFTLVLTTNVTSIVFTNLPLTGFAQSLWVRLKQDATGSRTIAFPASFKATTGSALLPGTAPDAYTILSLTTVDQGARWEYTMLGADA